MATYSVQIELRGIDRASGVFNQVAAAARNLSQAVNGITGRGNSAVERLGQSVRQALGNLEQGAQSANRASDAVSRHVQGLQQTAQGVAQAAQTAGRANSEAIGRNAAQANTLANSVVSANQRTVASAQAAERAIVASSHAIRDHARTLSSAAQTQAQVAAQNAAAHGRGINPPPAAIGAVAAGAAASPLRSFFGDLINTESEWSKAQNRIAVATENAREVEDRAGLRSEAAQAARHAANVQRMNENLALVQRVGRETIYTAAQVGNAFADLNFAGIPEAASRAMLPLVARYGQAAEIKIEEAGRSVPRLVRGTFGNQAVQDPSRVEGLSRFATQTVVAAANVSGANVTQLDSAARIAAPIVMGIQRRRIEREVAQDASLAPDERLRQTEERMKAAYTRMMAQLAVMVQAGAQGAEAGRALAATETRLGALPDAANRILRTAGVNVMNHQVMEPDSSARVVQHLRQNLPNVSETAQRQIAAVYAQEGLSAAQRFDQSNRILATQGGAGGAAMTPQNALKAARVLREGHNASVASTDTEGVIQELERKSVNPASFKAAIGQYHAPKIANLETSEVDRVARQTAERAADLGYLEKIEKQVMAGLSGAMQKLESAIDSAKRAFFTTFGPDLISLMGKAEQALEAVSNVLTARNPDGSFVNQGLRDMVRYGIMAAGALALALPVLGAIGMAAIGVWGIAAAFKGVAAVVAGTVGVIGTVAGVILSIPVAIGAAVAAAAGFAIFKNLGGSLEPFMRAVQNVKDAFSSLWEAGKALFSGDWSKAGEHALSALGSIGAALGNLALSLGRAALGALSAAWDGVTAWATRVGQSMQQLATNIAADVSLWFQGLPGRLAAAWAGIVSAAGQAWEGVKSAAGSALDWVVAKVGSVMSTAGAIVSGAWAGIVSGVSAAWNTLTGIMSAGWQTVVGFVQGLPAMVAAGWQGLVSMVSALPGQIAGAVATMVAGIAGAFPNLTAAAQGAWDTVKAIFNGDLGAAVRFGSETWAAITKGASETVEAVMGYFRGLDLGAMVQGSVDAVAGAFRSIATAFDANVVQPIRKLWADTVGWIGTEINRALSRLPRFLGGTGGQSAPDPTPAATQAAPAVQVPPSLPVPSAPVAAVPPSLPVPAVNMAAPVVNVPPMVAPPMVPQSMPGLVLPANPAPVVNLSAPTVNVPPMVAPSLNIPPMVVTVPQLPQAPQVPQSPVGMLTVPTPDVAPLTGAAKAVEGAARDASGPAGALAEKAGQIAGQAAGAASNLDAVARSLSALSNLRITMPQVTTPAAPASPAAPAAVPAMPAPQRQSEVVPFRSFADAGVRPSTAMSGGGSINGSVGVDVRVRAEPGTQARTIAQSRGQVESKLDAGFSDIGFV